MKTTIASWAALSLLAAGSGPTTADAQPRDNHYQSAQAALAKGNADKAEVELRLSLQDDSFRAESHLLLGSLLARKGDVDQAVVGFQRTLALEPNNAVARYNLGTSLLWRGEPIAAARQLELAVSLRPDYVPAYNSLAKAYFQAGLPELAVAGYKEALHLDPANAIARKNVALLLTADAGIPQSPGAGHSSAPTLSAGAPGKTIAPGPLIAAASGKEKQAPLTEPSRTATAGREAGDEAEVKALQEIARDLPHVTVEWRGGKLVLAGWTTDPKERKLLDRILAGRPDVLDLTGDDTGDPQRLLEVDATLFVVNGVDSMSVGKNFLERITVNASVADAATAGFSWLYSAAISYDVNIANALNNEIAILARPHLTTLSGTPATFIAGGDIVYKVSGTTSGDIKPYPFGTILNVVPTLLRTRSEDGSPRIRISVKTGRKSIFPIQTPDPSNSTGSTIFDNVEVTSEAVVGLGQSLILTGLSQRESHLTRTGIPGLRSVPIIKYLFSSTTSLTSDLAIIILLTPRDPAYWDAQNRKSLEEFVEKRHAYVQAVQGTEADMQRFKERYPDWDKLAPNRFASHFFLMKNSTTYRAASGMDLASESLDFDLLGKASKPKEKK